LHRHLLGGYLELLATLRLHREWEEAGIAADDALRYGHAPVKDCFAPAFRHGQPGGRHFRAAFPPDFNLAWAARAAMQHTAEIRLAEQASSARRAEHVTRFEAGFVSRAAG